MRRCTRFLFAFPTNLAPVVGQQVTLRADSGEDVLARIELFEQRAGATFVMPGNAPVTECELVAKVVIDRRERGFLFEPSTQTFRDDTGGRMPSAVLRGLASNTSPVTFTCMYPGGGVRFGLDRDLDGAFDGGGTAPPPPAPGPNPQRLSSPDGAPGDGGVASDALIQLLRGLFFGEAPLG